MQLSKGLPLLPWIKANEGFTILEMIIVFIIAIILTLMAIPSFITFVQEHRLKKTAENAFVALQYARSEATKSNSTVYVTFATGDNWCYGINTGSSCTCSTASSCNRGATQAGQTQQIDLSTTNLVSNSFQIDGTRGATNISNGKITFTLYGQSTSISILIGSQGNIQLCSPSFSGYQACP
jgi:type IV fimbrial biogenesis protein FimT